MDATVHATAAKQRSKPAPVSGSAFDLQKLFEFPKFTGFEMPKVPTEFRELSEFGASYAKQSYDRMKAVAEEANTALENTYASTSKGASEYGLKVLEFARVNTNSAFNFYAELLSARSLSDLVELSTARARAQMDATMTQSRELGALAQKLTTESLEPLKQSFTKAFNKAA